MPIIRDQRAAILTAMNNLARVLSSQPEISFPEGISIVANDPKFENDPRRKRAVAFRVAANAVEDAFHTIGPIQAGPAEMQTAWKVLYGLGSLCCLPAPEETRLTWTHWFERLGGKTPAGGKRPSNVPTFNLKTGVLTMGGNAYTATSSERHVLRVLVERQTATLPELEQAAKRPDRVLKGLLKKYPALKKRITLPGRAGHGGYSTTIEPARTSP
jgi:hypothetical protein